MRTSLIHEIEELHRARPFRPFSIILDDGQRVFIKRPEFLGLFPKRDKIFYSTLEDTTEVVEVRRISRVQPGRRPAA